MCVRVYVCVQLHKLIWTLQLLLCWFVYVYVCVCVLVSVFAFMVVEVS